MRWYHGRFKARLKEDWFPENYGYCTKTYPDLPMTPKGTQVTVTFGPRIGNRDEYILTANTKSGLRWVVGADDFEIEFGTGEE